MISKLLIPLLIAAQLPAFAEEEDEEKKNNSILTRVPIGATSTNVTIPSFDEYQKRASLLTAKVVVVDSAAKLSAQGLLLYLFDKEEKINATAKIDTANFLLEEERLLANGNIHLQSTDKAFEIKSEGGIFQLPTRRGLFLGPGYTLITDPPKKNTAVNFHPLLPLTASLQLLIAVPPPEITAEELSRFERMVAPRLIPASDVDEVQAAADAENLKVAKRLTNYLATIGKTELLTQIKAPVVIDPLKEEELKDNQTSIEFDGGAYFDGDNLEVVYLGNIVLKRTTFTMTCNKDLKVILEEAVENKEKKADTKEEKSTFAGLGELKQLTASGNLEVEAVDEKGKKIVMKGDRALYDKSKESLLVRGDNLFFRQGNTFARATHKDAYISAKFDGKRIKNAQLSKNGWKIQFTDPEEKNNQ
jgi:lipopolysaccharide assembly outer membrane protein LptD (OstA)